MNDIYGRPCTVAVVRTFKDGRQLGAGFDTAGMPWFVYDRRSADEPWHKHCGPYSTREQAEWWIKEIREEAPR